MFKFRLQRVLELREQAEQAKARELASAQDAADVVRRAHEDLERLHAASRAEVNAAQTGELRIGHLQQLGLVLQSLDQRLETSNETVRAADAVVADAQSLLESAARDRRILDRLKDRHTDQFRALAAQKDRLGMDEIALARFSRTAESRATDDGAIRATREASSRAQHKPDGSST